MSKQTDPIEALVTVLKAAAAYARQIVPGRPTLDLMITDAPLATVRMLEAAGGESRDSKEQPGRRYTTISRAGVNIMALWSAEAGEAARLDVAAPVVHTRGTFCPQGEAIGEARGDRWTCKPEEVTCPACLAAKPAPVAKHDEEQARLARDAMRSSPGVAELTGFEPTVEA